MESFINKILQGDAGKVLRTLPTGSIDTCITSPPYFGLRDYGDAAQIGLEDTPEKYVESLVAVFGEVKRVLRADGTLWLNLGDSYASNRKGGSQGKNGARADRRFTASAKKKLSFGLKDKDLIGIPWRVAFALQADGWYLRQDIIWNKPNPMPESVRDRCTKAHEYIFLFSKQKKYYFDADAIRTPLKEYAVPEDPKDLAGTSKLQAGTATASLNAGRGRAYFAKKRNPKGANKRSVWTVSTRPYKGAHFATFSSALIEPCVLAGAPKGGLVLDPFFGSGTTGECAIKNGRAFVGIELNPEYIAMAQKRLAFIQTPLL